MLADRARLKTPIPAYRSYTLGAGVYELKGEYTVGYDAQVWGIGSLSPTDFRGYFVGQMVHHRRLGLVCRVRRRMTSSQKLSCITAVL